MECLSKRGQSPYNQRDTKFHRREAEMSHPLIEQFLADCESCCEKSRAPSEIVLDLAPRMEKLLAHADDFLTPEHRKPDPNQYARHAVYVCPQGGLSLFTMVWSPGQWTPIHDHGTWGVVGVIKGRLEERSFVRTDQQDDDALSQLELTRSGVVILGEGSICTFVPDPDHIHRTGCAEGGQTTVTLHLYGRAMTNYHVYDVDAGTRELIDVSASEPDFSGA